MAAKNNGWNIGEISRVHLYNKQTHIYLKFEVSITNISGFIEIIGARREQILLLDNEYLKYWPNYLYTYAQ